MSKLFKLKKWLTLDETVQHLTAVLGEPVYEKDVFRLVLDGFLKLSVDFVNHATVNQGKYIEESEVEYREMPNILGMKVGEGEEKTNLTFYPSALKFGDGRFVKLEEGVVSIDGVWDLPMIGGERIDVEHYYQVLTGGPEVKLDFMEGPFVEKAGVVCRVVERFENYNFDESVVAKKKGIEARIKREKLSGKDAEQLRQSFGEWVEVERFKGHKTEAYYPADILPKDSVFVVRTSAILDLLNSLGEGSIPAEQDGVTMGCLNATGSTSMQLLDSSYWQGFNKLVQLAIKSFPVWCQRQEKIQKTGNLQDWLVGELKADNREAEIIKKILSDIYKKSFKSI